jgi:GMP synthase (glutamine-hydrolysing)
MRRLLLYKTGETDRKLVCDIGDYEAWFARVLGERVVLELHRAFDAPHHRVGGYDGLIVSGSPRSLVEPEPWMDEAAAFLRRAADAGVPVLGVCFGHQLLGYAWGGRVRVNPNGWEVGTVLVELTEAGRHDPLFDGVPHTLHVNQSHRDEVAVLGPEVSCLAASAHTETQSLAVGAHVRGVQFHPEMNGAVVRRIMEHRRQLLADDLAQRQRPHSIDELIGRSGDTPDAERVLANFARHFVRAA